MRDFWSELFLSCLVWMYTALILFSLACLAFFENALVSEQILEYYGSAMMAGAASGAFWYYFRLILKMKRSILKPVKLFNLNQEYK